MDNIIGSDMIRGHIDTIIMLSLVAKDKDSNEIRNDIESKSENKYQIKQGTFYSAMQRLVKQDLISEYRSSSIDGIRRKYYKLTDGGKKFLDKNRDEWNYSKELIDNLTDSKTQIAEETINPPARSEMDLLKDQISEKDDFKLKIENNNESDSYLDKLGEEVLGELKFAESADAEKKHNDCEKVSAESETESNLIEEKKLNSVTNTKTEPQEELKFFDFNSGKIVSENELNKNSEISDAENEDNVSEDSLSENIDKIQPSYENSISESIDVKQFNNAEVMPEKASVTKSNGIFESDNNAFSETKSGEEKLTPPNEKFNDISSVPYNSAEPEVKINIINENKPIENSPIIIFADSHNYSADSDSVKNKNLFNENRLNKFPPLDNETAEKPDDNKNNISQEDDDFLYIDDDKPKAQRDYKSILKRLFPQRIEKEEKKIVVNENIPFEEPSPLVKTNNVKKEKVVTKNFKKTSDTDTSNNLSQSSDSENLSEFGKVEKNAEKIMKSEINSEKCDFGDLYRMADREGFKIKTSLATNKYESKKIYINKLRFHASFIFYILLFIEMLILKYSFNNILNFSNKTCIIIAVCMFIFTFVNMLNYVLARKKKVFEIPSFKNAMEVSLIITFQLLVIIIGFAIISEVDFDNLRAVLLYIALPGIIALNIPIYFIIKYSLLERKTYFDK